MKKESIKLLNLQLEKLDAKDFDLESWKKYSLILLSRIFGEKSDRIKMIENLEYEHSSWSLRDASGNESYMDSTKKLAREIITASIDEISNFGLPKNLDNETDEDTNIFMGFVLDGLKGSQIKEINKIKSTNLSDEEKKRQVYEIVSEMDIRSKNEIITKMLLS